MGSLPQSKTPKEDLEKILREHKKVLNSLKSQQDALIVEQQLWEHLTEYENDTRR